MIKSFHRGDPNVIRLAWHCWTCGLASAWCQYLGLNYLQVLFSLHPSATSVFNVHVHVCSCNHMLIYIWSEYLLLRCWNLLAWSPPTAEAQVQFPAGLVSLGTSGWRWKWLWSSLSIIHYIKNVGNSWKISCRKLGFIWSFFLCSPDNSLRVSFFIFLISGAVTPRPHCLSKHAVTISLLWQVRFYFLFETLTLFLYFHTCLISRIGRGTYQKN